MSSEALSITDVDAPALECVLVVDDEASVRETIVDIIKMGGQSCVSVSCAAEAIEHLKSGKIDLVLTDMHMPGESGLDLIDRIQEIDKSIPVVLITGFPSVNSAINAMKRGAIDFITKPFDLDSIRHVVEKALRERRMRKEIGRLQADVDKARVIENLNRELKGRVFELEQLYVITDSMSQFMDTDSLFTHLVELAQQVTGAQRVSLMIFNRGRQYLKIRSASGVPGDVVESTRVRVGTGVSGKVAKDGKLVRATRHINSQFRATRDTNAKDRYQSQSWMSIPVHIGDEIFGVINLTDKPDGSDFTYRDEQIIQILIEKAAVKLENQALYEGIYTNLVDTLNSLVTTIEAKDPYTREHSHRVTEYALTLATMLGVDDAGLEMIEFAGVLHDIGKIGVRDEILTKTGGLTDVEYEAIKQHVVIGDRIVEPLGLTDIERSIIRNHHERFDGKGYPDGLAGEDIPWLVRIVSVADAFDAMTSTRPYRKALVLEHAVTQLKENRGIQFDPKVTDAMLEALDKKIITLALLDA